MHSFLPNNTPLEKLEGKEFEGWESIAQNLANLNKSHQITEEVHKLSVIDHTKLKTLVEKQRAYSILSQIAHSYAHHDKTKIVKTMPKQIAVPYYHIATELGLPPVLTHSAVDLWDWFKKDNSKGMELENLDKLTTMTGTDDEKTFCLIMTAIEAIGAECLDDITNLPDNINDNNIDKVTKATTKVTECLKRICETMRKMKAGCQPEVFYHTLRPYLGGWLSRDRPEGMYFEDVDKVFKYDGGSASQSSLVQAFDIFLGVKQSKGECKVDEKGNKVTDSNGNEVKHPNVKGYLDRMRDYMPKEHREYLNKLEKDYEKVDLFKYLDKCDKGDLYKNCVRELVKFRKIHYGQIENYILKFIPKHVTAKGTGNTELVDFLTSCIEKTEERLKVRNE